MKSKQGTVLRVCRYEKQWTQKKLSEVSHVHVVTISKLEKGKIQGSLRTWGKLIKALGVSWDRFNFEL